MSELKSIGEKRLEYLDLANKAWSASEYDAVQNFIDSFLTTIRDDSSIATEISESFDKAEKKKNDSWDKLVKDSAQLDSQMQCEQRFYGWQDIALLNLKERLNACWQIAVKRKLLLPTSLE